MSVSDEPCPNVFAVARYASQYAPVLVVSHDRDSNVFADDLSDQCTLDALSVIEPVAVLVFRELIPLGRVESSKTYVVPGYPYPVAIGHICLAGDRSPGPFLEQTLEEKVDCRDGWEGEVDYRDGWEGEVDYRDGQAFHAIYTFLLATPYGEISRNHQLGSHR